MPDSIRKIAYFKVDVPDKAGEGARILSALKAEGVNLAAFTGFPRGRRAQLDLFPADEAAFRKAAKKVGIATSGKKTAFLIQGNDRRGAMADIVSALADAGINVTALDGVAAGGRRFGAMLFVRPGDVARTARVLKAR